jgi:hypothetical protein
MATGTYSSVVGRRATEAFMPKAKTKARTRKTVTKAKPRATQARASVRVHTKAAATHVWPGLPPGYFDRAR